MRKRGGPGGPRSAGARGAGDEGGGRAAGAGRRGPRARRGGAGPATAAVAVAAAILASPLTGVAQQDEPAPTTAGDRPAAAPADVESIDAIVTALYDVISGAKGEERDWDRLRSLMYPGAIFLPNYPGQSGGPRAMTVEEFIGFAKESIRQEGFYESEADRTVQRYGPVANVFSTYESRRAPDEEPFVRGINSIQLVHDGDRWWVAHIAWTDVSEAGPIPERYGGQGGG